MGLKDMLEDKNIRYILMFLTATNLLGYLAYSKINAAAFFVLVGVITYFINKNPSVVMLVPLFLTNMLMASKVEGFYGKNLEERGDFECVTDYHGRLVDDQIKQSINAINSYKPDQARDKIKNREPVELEYNPWVDPNNPDLNVKLDEPTDVEPNIADSLNESYI
jgi:hypothetical protein